MGNWGLTYLSSTSELQTNAHAHAYAQTLTAIELPTYLN